MKRHIDPAGDFGYLSEPAVYLDSACQSLRPQPVIDALGEYYTSYGSCGERVKYAWGVKVDEQVEHTRELVLKYLKLRSKDYFVSFTLNTTYGINLILSQIKTDGIKKVMTSDIEHNSPFLATITFAEKHQIPREVMTRQDDGSINLNDYDFTGALVVVNSASNIDGRQLLNLNDLIKAVHRGGGIIIIDAAQAMAHLSTILEKTEADAICFSAHKMYAPSLGVIVMRRDLLPRIQTSFIGGGMVDDVTSENGYLLSADHPDHAYTKFEAGLQAWGEIIALGTAIEWLTEAKKSSRVEEYANQLFQILKNTPGINVINQTPTPTISWYHEKLDAHLLAEALSDQGIMTRSGYFCCHYYLDKVKKYPPLVRMSLGLHNKATDIERIADVLKRIG
ncbi:aminotransferase class V-fold PLP-dependent enzyme [Candidatus Saccharibacteria bacterium]|nr:aminotransferase class V-fold PLP-dependent enzyme [Candidatus Saccharibacteria bacterium]